MHAINSQNLTMNSVQHITRGPLGKAETRFLAKIAGRATFTIEAARAALAYTRASSAQKFLERLQEKGWIKRLRRGCFAIIPLSSGDARTPQLHEFIVAMELVSPAAIAYWSALNHHGLTEQLPRTVFIATNHPVRRPPRQALGVNYKLISVKPTKFFGIVKDWMDEQPFQVTDKEKTLIDGLDLPQYVGGVDEIAKALAGHWPELNETKLRHYAARIGNSAVAKRLGFLLETLKLGDPDALREAVPLASGFSPLDPTLPQRGKYHRRWGLLVNVEVKA